MDRSQLAAIWLEKGNQGPYRILGKEGAADGESEQTSVSMSTTGLPRGLVEAARVARAAGEGSSEMARFFECVPDEVVPIDSRVLFVPDVHEPAGFTVLIETDTPAHGAAALEIKRRVAAALVQVAEAQRRRLGEAGGGASASTGTAG